jgi:hypothetical protein
MKYIIGVILTISVGLNLAFLTSLKRYQIEIREQKRNTDQKISYYEYWSFTMPRSVNELDTALLPVRVARIDLGGGYDSSLPERNYYVQFSHE